MSEMLAFLAGALLVLVVVFRPGARAHGDEEWEFVCRRLDELRDQRDLWQSRCNELSAQLERRWLVDDNNWWRGN